MLGLIKEILNSRSNYSISFTVFKLGSVKGAAKFPSFPKLPQIWVDVRRVFGLPSCPPPAGRFRCRSHNHNGTAGIPAPSRAASPAAPPAAETANKTKNEWKWSNNPQIRGGVIVVGGLYLSVLLNDDLWCRTQNDIEVQNPPNCAVGESWRGLERYIWKYRQQMPKLAKISPPELWNVEKMKQIIYFFPYPFHCCWARGLHGRCHLLPDPCRMAGHHTNSACTEKEGFPIEMALQISGCLHPPTNSVGNQLKYCGKHWPRAPNCVGPRFCCYQTLWSSNAVVIKLYRPPILLSSNVMVIKLYQSHLVLSSNVVVIKLYRPHILLSSNVVVIKCCGH